MDRRATASRTKVMNKGALPVTPRGSADLAQSLKADLLTSLDAIGRQGNEGGLEVPCPIAPPMISPPATPNHDLPHGSIPAPAMAEHSVHGGNAAWWDAPVAPAKSWHAPPDCVELLQRPAQGCGELLQHPSQDCVELLQHPPTDCAEVFRGQGCGVELLQRPSQDCVELLQRPPPTDCVAVLKAHKPGRQIPRQVPPRQQQALSANAPEFVPEGSSVVVSAALPSSVALQRTMLEDSIRSALQQGDLRPEEVVSALSTPPVQKSVDPDSMSCPPTSVPPVAQPWKESNTSSMEEESGDAEQQIPPINIKVEDLPDHIPSIGSLGHECGNCRRCNFFHKGRCSNGRSCAFCHLPHDKRKTARKDSQLALAEQASSHFQIACGAPGLELPDQLTPRTMPVPLGSRPRKVSMGTQTEDDLPPCILCCEPPSAQDMAPPLSIVLKREKGTREEHSVHQGNLQAARIGGC